MPAHSSNLVQQFLVKHKITQLRQPRYSPDIAPYDFWMFPKLKIALEGKRFNNIETIQSNATRELKAILKSAFGDCYNISKHRSEDVVQSNGDSTVRMTKNSTNAEIRTQVGYFSDTSYTLYGSLGQRAPWKGVVEMAA